MERMEHLFKDIDEIFGPKTNFSDKPLKDKWRIVEVGTSEYSGKMIASMPKGEPEDLVFSPNLKGWHKIYFSIPFLFPDICPEINVKLTSQNCFTRIAASPFGLSTVRWMTMHECFWTCADLTGESLILTKKKGCVDKYSVLSAIRFVSMTESEIEDWKRESERTDTKNLYVTDDIHNMFCRNKIESVEDFRSVVGAYRNSDAEWLSIENIRSIVSDNIPHGEIDDTIFPREYDYLVQKQCSKIDIFEVLKNTVKYAHEDKLKVSVSLRMGAWGMLFPYDAYYFDNAFIKAHPEFCCIDRNGDRIPAMSYAYPEVRKYMIEELIYMAETGCDAVALISHRGIPYVLFEKPIADRFYDTYGEYPYELPLDDERLNKIHCEIMTEFFREAREALDRKFGKDKVKIHLRALFSLYDSKYIGLDVEKCASEGLIDTFISYPQRCYEVLYGDIWQENKEYKVDLEKYTTHMRTKIRSIMRISDIDFIEPYRDYRGIMRGPASQKERVKEWNLIEKRYGTKVYFEIMPRQMPNAEFKRRVTELYDVGAERFGLWDTNERAAYRAMWSFVGKIGHKDEIKDMDVSEGKYYRNFVIYSVGGKDFSRYDPIWGG